MIKGRPILSKEIILSKISSEDIFREYCSPFKNIGEHFQSELRVDPKPSCVINWIRGDLMYSDFGDGLHIRCIEYVKLKFNLSYYDALEKIYYDFKLDERDSGTKEIFGSNSSGSNNIRSFEWISNNKLRHEKQPTIIRIKKRIEEGTRQSGVYYRPYDLKYWEDFYWTEWMLKESKTFAISHYFLNNHKTNFEDKVYAVGNERAFVYDYYWHEGTMRRKLYFPDRKENKWISNVDDSIVQLVDVAPKTGDILFITSSKKDGGIFWRMQLENMFPGLVIHGVAPNSEHTCVPSMWLEKMRGRWKYIILYYDFDDSGIKNAIKFSQIFNLPYLNTESKGLKDPSDFSKKLGILEFKNKLITDLKQLDIRV